MIPSKDILDKIKFLADNYKKLPYNRFEYLEVNKNKKVLWILDRQKPSVEPDWNFDEERLGITDEGNIIYGFDSGCSCPLPWNESNDEDAYYMEKTWKELELDLSDLEEFDYFEEYHLKYLDDLCGVVKDNE